MIVEVRDRRRLEERLETQTESESQTAEAAAEAEAKAETETDSKTETEAETEAEAATRPDAVAERQRRQRRRSREVTTAPFIRPLVRIKGGRTMEGCTPLEMATIEPPNAPMNVHATTTSQPVPAPPTSEALDQMTGPDEWQTNETVWAGCVRGKL